MSTMTMPGNPPDVLDVMLREIESCKKEHKPTSRHRLAELITKETGLTFRDALAEVEAYCDQKEPAIPEYLSTEFGIFWLKVVSVVNVVVGTFLFYQGVSLYRTDRPAWPMWALGTLFVGIAAFIWVRSIEAESDRKL